MGRPTKCTEELTEELCGHLEKGNFIKPACQAAGITERTYHKWRERGRDELERIDGHPRRRVRKSEKPFVQFLRSTNRARSKAEAKCVEVLMNAAEGNDGNDPDWKAALAYLERAHSERWNKKIDLEGALDLTTGGRPLGGGPTAEEIEEMSPEEKTTAFKDMIRGISKDEGTGDE